MTNNIVLVEQEIWRTMIAKSRYHNSQIGRIKSRYHNSQISRINVKLTMKYICSNAVKMMWAYEFKRTSLLKFNFWITVQRALPWPPNKLFYKLANQDTRIWLTVTPPCRVQQASDATTNYWKHVVLYFMNKEEDICWRTQQLCTRVTLMLLGYIYPQLRK